MIETVVGIACSPCSRARLSAVELKTRPNHSQACKLAAPLQKRLVIPETLILIFDKDAAPIASW